jgi:cell division protein FtsQ
MVNKNKIKHILSIIVMVLLLGYAAFAAVAFSPKPADMTCTGVVVRSMGRGASQFENNDEILSILRRQGLDPTGHPMEQVSCAAIEDTLSHLSLVLRCECYKTVTDKVCIDITCRTPILRVLPDGGSSFYVDREGVVVDRLPRPTYLPVATGRISKEFATQELRELASYLQHSTFWDSQIEQIHVLAAGEVELIPRVGDHLIRFGKVENIKYKFGKLKTFYEKGLSQVGWDRYAVIDIRYGNQVIGVKKNKE